MHWPEEDIERLLYLSLFSSLEAGTLTERTHQLIASKPQRSSCLHTLPPLPVPTTVTWVLGI